MYRISVILMIAFLWGGMFWGALAIAKLDLGYLPSICGPWGCLSGLAPLLSVHSMWLVLLGGGFTLSRWAIPKLHPRWIWGIGAAIGACSVVGLWGFEFASFANRDGKIDSPAELIKFLAFHTIRSIDIPVIEFLLATAAHSLVPWGVSRTGTGIHAERET